MRIVPLRGPHVPQVAENPHEVTVTELRTHEGELPHELRTEWELLCDEDPDATVFHGPRYLETWGRVFAGGVPVRVHTVHRDGRLIGVVADANDLSGSPAGPQEIRRFQGGSEVTDYLGPVSRPEDRADVADAYVANLARDVDWDEFIAGGLAADTGWPQVFRAAAAQHGLTVVTDEVEDVCPRVDISGGYEAYLDALPGKLRQELTRKTRKLSRDAGALELVEVAPDEVPGRLDDFLDQAAESDPDKRGFFRRAKMHEWFRVLADEFAGDRVFRLHELQVGGLPAASAVSLVDRRTWGLYNTAFDPAMGSLAPGMVIVNLLIDVAATDGARTFDFLRGDEPYKYRFGASDRVLHRVTVGRR